MNKGFGICYNSEDSTATAEPVTVGQSDLHVIKGSLFIGELHQQKISKTKDCLEKSVAYQYPMVIISTENIYLLGQVVMWMKHKYFSYADQLIVDAKGSKSIVNELL
jgi:hypothetical protein